MSERITYLVPNYNNGWAYSDLLASLEIQTNENWLCVVCDDCSTDDSWAIITKLTAGSTCRDQITLLRNSTNLGLIGTLKRLIDAATTDIVGVLDADDALEPDATEEILLAYERVPEAGFVYSQFRYMDTELSHIWWRNSFRRKLDAMWRNRTHPYL